MNYYCSYYAWRALTEANSCQAAPTSRLVDIYDTSIESIKNCNRGDPMLRYYIINTVEPVEMGPLEIVNGGL